MKRLIKSFSKNQISTQEATNIKGGNIFCEWYISYTTANTLRPSANVMADAMELDSILAKQGMKAAMLAGGADFMATYS